MHCNHCQMPCGENDQFCASCGAVLKPAKKRGRHWVPLLIMAVLVLCCTALFYAIPLETAEPARLTGKEMPWFSVEKGILYFDESQYTGGSQLTVPSSIVGADVTAISDGCFRGCEELTAIVLPDTLKAIGEEAFQGCTALRGLEIPESVAFIGKSAFSGCTALEAVCISNKLQQIGTDSFDGCTGLRFVYFLGKYQEWTALYRDFPDSNVVISCEDGKFSQAESPN